MGKTLYTDRITAAHQTGHLFAHMLEGPIEKEGLEGGDYPLKNLFEVMAKKPDAHYENNYDHSYHVTDRGIVGLAATSLKTPFTVNLFADISRVGLLMDTAQPILVNSVDSFTKVEGNTISFRSISEYPPDLATRQGLKPGPGSFDMMVDLDGRIALAENALKSLWNEVGQHGWDTYCSSLPKSPNSSMNEVNVAANLGDICGIVINEQGSGKLLGSYEEAVVSAQKLKTYLLEHYPDKFKASLPIMSYDVHKGTLKEISPNKSWQETMKTNLVRGLGMWHS